MSVSCQTTHELFSEYYDGGLRPEERRALEEHLKACAGCTVEFRHFTESLDALRKTKSIETSQLFLTNVKAAAAAHLQKRESYLRPRQDSQTMTVVTPKADGSETVPLGKAAPGPWPMRLALAGVLLAGFALGFFVFGRREDGPDARQLQALVEEALRNRPPERVVVKEPVDEEEVLRGRGLVKADGQWVPKQMADDFRRGLVCLGGRMMTREEAAKALAKEFPPAQPPVPLPPPAPDPDKLVEEALAKAGYRRVNDVHIPEAWLAKWGEGLVQVGVNEWKKASEFKEELIREHNLVEVRGKLMTREQAESLQAQQLVRTPDAATAVNEVTRALSGLQIGPPMNYRGLTVYPLLAVGDAPPPAGLTPLHAAQGQGKLELSEDRFFVAQAKNGLEEDVLFLAGEVLAGGRCARVVAEDTTVPRGQTGRVPVFCAEPGSWRGGEQFAKESGHYVAPPSLRRLLALDQGQGAVWSLLAKRVDKTRPGLVDLFRKHAEAVSDIRAYFTVLPDREPTAVGAAVAVGNALEFVELFQDHALFAAYFDRILMGAALDALERTADAPPRGAPTVPNSVRGVKQFLESAFFWTYEAREDGYGIRKDDTGLGRARVTGGFMAHAQLFTPRAPEWDRRTVAPVPKDKMTRVIADYEGRMKTLGPARKAAVLHDLASIGSPEVTVVLVRHLNETDTMIRRAAVQELGASGDLRATEPLVQVLTRSRAELPLYAEAVRALARLGDERAVEPILQQLDGADSEGARVLIQGLPELLLQVRNRELLARATARLVVLFEAAEGVSKGELGLDPVTKNMRPAEAEALAAAARTALTQLVGIEFQSSAGCRKWWNDRETRERFLKERTGK